MYINIKRFEPKTCSTGDPNIQSPNILNNKCVHIAATVQEAIDNFIDARNQIKFAFENGKYLVEKNNYANIKLWDYPSERFVPTGLQFCGLIMGDHSKSGINTMFNTGTVVGVSANIFGSGFPRNFVPSFSWGGSNGFTTYLTKKAFEVAQVVISRRHIEFTEQDAAILEHVFEDTKKYRRQ